ncbi:hypothetical protein MMC20_003752 [Loxospora ochrophaea]|nr:hypothetical protein [Loxospora ochrophaea]
MFSSKVHWLVVLAIASRTLGQDGSSGGGGASAAAAAAAAQEEAADVDNVRFATYVLVIIASTVLALAIYRVVLASVRYVRTLTCLNNNTQQYFKAPNRAFGSLKQYLLYAPLFRKRHGQEMQLSSRLGFGILPTRFQSLFLGAVIGVNVALCVVGIEWHGPSSTMLKHLRNRSGTLSVVNMIPLVILSGRNNPLISLLNISYDSFNLVHRWFGRIVMCEAVIHTAAWAVSKAQTGGWSGVATSLRTDSMMYTGLLGTVAAVAMSIQASSIVRHAFYEFFLHLHIILAILLMVGLWLHLDGFHQQLYLLAAIIAWATERFVRTSLLLYRSWGKGGTKAVVEALPGDAIRVTVKMARPWIYRPGQHMYITIPSVGLWTSHPFSVAWSDEEERLDSEKGLAMNRQDVLGMRKSTMSLIIRRRGGFTNLMHQKAEKALEGQAVVNAWVEGPYGGLHSLHSYGTVMLFAGGVGITHQVPYVRDLVAGFANGTVAARRVILIWIIQSPEHLEWIRPWMTTILAMDRRRDILRIQLFVTRPRSTKEIHSPSATVQMFPGRPNVNTLIEMESENQIGTMGVSVCGTGSLGDDVRQAVRRRQAVRNVDFVEESFSW